MNTPPVLSSERYMIQSPASAGPVRRPRITETARATPSPQAKWSARSEAPIHQKSLGKTRIDELEEFFCRNEPAFSHQYNDLNPPGDNGDKVNQPEPADKKRPSDAVLIGVKAK